GVHEPADLPLVVEDALADAGVLLLQVRQQRADGRPLGLHLLQSGGELAQRGGDAYGRHGRLLLKASNSDRRAAMIGGRRRTGTSGAGGLSPWPGMHTAMLSPGSMRPSARRRRVAARVTPPAVSVKMPSVSASRRIASTISSSEAAAAHPPDARIAWLAYQPSAGLPMASDLAMVSGLLTGRMCSCPSRTAVTIGAQPAACAPWRRA